MCADVASTAMMTGATTDAAAGAAHVTAPSSSAPAAPAAPSVDAASAEQQKLVEEQALASELEALKQDVCRRAEAERVRSLLGEGGEDDGDGPSEQQPAADAPDVTSTAASSSSSGADEQETDLLARAQALTVKLFGSYGTPTMLLPGESQTPDKFAAHLARWCACFAEFKDVVTPQTPGSMWRAFKFLIDKLQPPAAAPVQEQQRPPVLSHGRNGRVCSAEA